MMTSETVKHVVHSSVLEKGGKFAVRIYADDSTTITQSDFRFDSEVAARKAGREIFDYGVFEMKEYAAEVFGGGNNAAKQEHTL